MVEQQSAQRARRLRGFFVIVFFSFPLLSFRFVSLIFFSLIFFSLLFFLDLKGCYRRHCCCRCHLVVVIAVL